MPVYLTYNSCNIWISVSTHCPFMFIEQINWQINMCINMTAVCQWVNQFYCYLLPYLPNHYLWHDITIMIIRNYVIDYNWLWLSEPWYRHRLPLCICQINQHKILYWYLAILEWLTCLIKLKCNFINSLLKDAIWQQCCHLFS